MAQVTFEYLTGLRQTMFESARLSGSWNGQGRRSDNWTTVAMTPFVAADGCPAYRATVTLDDAEVNQTFDWSESRHRRTPAYRRLGYPNSDQRPDQD